MKKRRETARQKPQLKALWQALDEAEFGPERTLNLRESLPTAAAAKAKADVWLRARQVTRAEDVLVITGRGNQSLGGVGVIRQQILAMLPALRRRGIVESWREHSPGSIVVKLAPVSALLGAGKRRRDNGADKPAPHIETVAGLQPNTLQILRQLAMQNLESLGIVATNQFVEQEMARTFSTLLSAVIESPEREMALHAAILTALDEQ